MSVSHIPIISHVVESGADDRVFDALLLTGPVAIVLIAVLGRTPLTGAVALAYIFVFIAHILQRGLQ